ncbi:MAG: DUF3784 domain-containing protein [Clostridiales bacterium]|nr:DUF3784 domain-containing protein [Clostridiales bacterium]
MDYTCIFFGILFTAAGILFAFGKGHIHLSAWKNMPREEKEKINIMPLCRNIGALITLSGIIFLAKGLWSGLAVRWFVWAMISWIIVAGIDIWHISKSNRYRNQ